MALDQPPATDPAAVVVGGPGQGISAAPPGPQPEDLPDSPEGNLDLLPQEDPIDVDALYDDCCMLISPVPVQAHVAAPPQPSQPRTEAPAPPSVLQPPPDHLQLPDNTEPSSGGAGPSRSRRRYLLPTHLNDQI